MREIKFRGKRCDNGEWLYGNLIVRMNGYVEIFDDRIEDYRTMRVDPYTVGQYTGLKDKNGKEIYEGDVLKHDSSTFSGVVAWNSKGYFYIKEEHILFPNEEPSCTPLGEMIEREDFVVIGDIHKKQNDEH